MWASWLQTFINFKLQLLRNEGGKFASLKVLHFHRAIKKSKCACCDCRNIKSTKAWCLSNAQIWDYIPYQRSLVTWVNILQSFIWLESWWETSNSFQATWPVFSKSISVSQLVAVPLKSSGSRTFLHSRLPAVSSWKMELSGLEGYMSRDSLTRPFVWLRWTQPDSSRVPALQHSLHYGQILLGAHSSQAQLRHCSCTSSFHLLLYSDVGLSMNVKIIKNVYIKKTCNKNISFCRFTV